VEKLHAQTYEVIGGNKIKIYFQATVCQTCVFAVPWTIKVGVTKFGNQENYSSILEKKVVICYQLRPNIKTYGH
jgi:hypothetical protein